MDIGRFHYALHTVVKDLRNTGANEQLHALISQLGNVANNPSNTAAFDQYKQQLESVRKALEGSSLNQPRLEVLGFLDEFDLKPFVGDGLFSSILQTIAEHQLSPSSALTALQGLLAQFSTKQSNLEAINTAFDAIEVPYEGEADGDSEIEIKIPVEYQTKTLEDLSKEAKEWFRDISTVSEVFDPERSETTIRTLSTGSWEFYLASTPLVVFGIAKCLKGVNSILSELIKSKQLLEQLKGNNAPQNVVADYENYLKDSVGKNLNELAVALVDAYYKGADDGRRAELKNALSQTLKRLSKKLSEGSKVSLRLTKPAAPKFVDEKNPTPEETAAAAEVMRIEEIRQAALLEMEKTELLEHDPEIAKALPAPDLDEADSN